MLFNLLKLSFFVTFIAKQIIECYKGHLGENVALSVTNLFSVIQTKFCKVQNCG